MNRTSDAVAAAIKAHGFDSLRDPLGSITLYDYQQEICRKAIERIAEGRPLGSMIYLMTGGGKTEIALGFARWLRTCAPTVSVGFMSNRDELVAQTARRARLCGLQAWRYQRGYESERAQEHCNVPMSQADLLVASSGTYVRRVAAGVAPIPDVAIMDEAHYKFYKTYLHLIASPLGLSATPYEPILSKWWERDLISGVTQYQLERRPYKILAAPKFLCPALDGQETLVVESEKVNRDVGEGAANYDREAADALFEQVNGRIASDLLETESRIKSDLSGAGSMHSVSYSERRWMVRAPNQNYAQAYARTLTDAGIPAKAFTSDSDSYKPRQLAEINAIFAGQSPHRAAVVVNKFVVGYDHPGIEGLILTNNMDINIFFQACGRVLRSGCGLKSTGWIVDLAGNVQDYVGLYAKVRFDPPTEIPRQRPRTKAKRAEPIAISDECGGGAVEVAEAELGKMIMVEMLTPEEQAERTRIEQAKAFERERIESETRAAVETESKARLSESEAVRQRMREEIDRLKAKIEPKPSPIKLEKPDMPNVPAGPHPARVVLAREYTVNEDRAVAEYQVIITGGEREGQKIIQKDWIRHPSDYYRRKCFLRKKSLLEITGADNIQDACGYPLTIISKPYIKNGKWIDAIDRFEPPKPTGIFSTPFDPALHRRAS